MCEYVCDTMFIGCHWKQGTGEGISCTHKQVVLGINMGGCCVTKHSTSPLEGTGFGGGERPRHCRYFCDQ